MVWKPPAFEVLQSHVSGEVAQGCACREESARLKSQGH